MRFLLPFLLASVVLLAPAALAAQTWHLPRFLPPQPGDEVAVYAVDTAPWGLLVGNWAVVADFRHSGDVNFGVRLGYHDYGENVRPAFHYILGLDSWHTFLRAAEGAPVDASFTGGIGASWGDGDVWITVPFGISVAREFRVGPVAVVPYLHPFLAPQVPGFSLDTGWGASAGANLRFGEAWSLRGDVAFGGDEALGIGIVWNVGRGDLR